MNKEITSKGTLGSWFSISTTILLYCLLVMITVPVYLLGWYEDPSYVLAFLREAPSWQPLGSLYKLAILLGIVWILSWGTLKVLASNLKDEEIFLVSKVIPFLSLVYGSLLSVLLAFPLALVFNPPAAWAIAWAIAVPMIWIIKLYQVATNKPILP